MNPFAATDGLQLIETTADGARRTVPIDADPFRIGRKEGCQLRLAQDGISRLHAELFRRGDSWVLVDCNSTNGTYVNRRRLSGEHVLCPGDVLQFGTILLQVAIGEEEPSERTRIINPHAASFERMMQERAVMALFQPIVSFADAQLFGCEALGRGRLGGAEAQPGQLFSIARRLDREVELSLLFRDTAIAEAAGNGLGATLFFNVLPAELELAMLGSSLQRTRERYPELKLMLELPETAVTRVEFICELRSLLRDLNIGLAYDDFGAGQARLLELLAAPPDVIKFDIGLIRGIDQRPQTAQAMLSAWVTLAQEAGISTLAEGVETAAEASTCREFGFDLAQGFHFGRPASLTDALAQSLPPRPRRYGTFG